MPLKKPLERITWVHKRGKAVAGFDLTNLSQGQADQVERLVVAHAEPGIETRMVRRQQNASVGFSFMKSSHWKKIFGIGKGKKKKGGSK